MRSYSMLLVCVVTLLVASATARAQTQDWSTTQCSNPRINQIRSAVTGALAKLTRVNNTPSNVFVPAFNRGFGLHAGLADFAAISIFAAYHMNIPAVLTNAPTINPFGGPPPTLPATVFKCGLNDAADGRPAQSVGDGIVVLYPRFFTLPLSGLWPTDTQIGTILHESVHVIGGPMDLAFNGNEANVQAEMLAGANDSRTLTNAYNYEFFYMGPEFF